MKRSLLLATLVSVALTSCVSETQEFSNYEQELKFEAPLLKQSRAAVKGEITGKKYSEAEKFVVFCKYYQGAYSGWTETPGIKDYFHTQGEVVTHGYSDGTSSSNYWESAQTHYWPDADHNLAFAAYSPAELPTAPDSIAQTATGLVITGFQTEAVADDQYDLMYSTRVYDRNKNNNGTDAVQLVFNHALTSITFSSLKSNNEINYQITGLKLSGSFYKKGDFNQGITGTVVSSNYTETDNPTWDNFSDNTSITFTPSFQPFNVPAGSPATFTSGTSAILLIPQVVPADATVTVDYDKTTNPGTAHEKTLSSTISIPLSSFKQGETDASISTWERGKKYIYRIAFGESTQIFFEPSINDWVTEPTLIYTIK